MAGEVLEVEEAWRELRRRVADRLTGMSSEQTLIVTAQVARLQDGPGPYVTVGRTGDDWRLEAVSNGYLDTAHRLDESAEGRLLALGWSEPTYLPGGHAPVGSANWWCDLESGHEEHAAWLLVETLREVYAVHHPAFLESRGLDLDGLRGPEASPAWDVENLPVLRPRDSEHLRDLVAETLTAMTGAPVHADDEGDVPMPCGDQSVVWVAGEDDRPVVTLFSVLVVDVTIPEAGLAALNLVAGRLPFLSARLLGDRLTVFHELHAMPFVPEHLAGWVARCQVELDEVAAELAVLLGGRRFLAHLEDGPDASDLLAVAPPVLDEEVAVVAELLADGARVPARVVAEVFGHDRRALVRRLVGLRQGQIVPHTDDLDALLAALRAGLRWIVDEPDRFADVRRRAGARSATRATVQGLLIDDQPDLFEPEPGAAG